MDLYVKHINDTYFFCMLLHNINPFPNYNIKLCLKASNLGTYWLFVVVVVYKKHILYEGRK